MTLFAWWHKISPSLSILLLLCNRITYFQPVGKKKFLVSWTACPLKSNNWSFFATFTIHSTFSKLSLQVGPSLQKCWKTLMDAHARNSVLPRNVFGRNQKKCEIIECVALTFQILIFGLRYWSVIMWTKYWLFPELVLASADFDTWKHLTKCPTSGFLLTKDDKNFWISSFRQRVSW